MLSIQSFYNSNYIRGTNNIVYLRLRVMSSMIPKTNSPNKIINDTIKQIWTGKVEEDFLYFLADIFQSFFYLRDDLQIEFLIVRQTKRSINVHCHLKKILRPFYTYLYFMPTSIFYAASLFPVNQRKVG